MTVAAFIYDDYYCYGLRASFAGLFSNLSDAREFTLGGRYTRQNLEVMDLETCGISKYTWLPLYEVINGEWITRENGERVQVTHLKHRWDKDKPMLELVWDGDVRGYGQHQMHYDAGK